MASRDIPEKVQQRMDKRKERNIARFSNYRTPKQTFLIICEGKNTEPDYFNEFKLGSAQVIAIGEGYNTISLVSRAIQIKAQYLVKNKKFDQYWVVFDKDDFSANDFNTAIMMAESNGFKVAYSNQAFEYWFLLHFNLYSGCINRDSYISILSDLLGFPYAKDSGTSSKMFNVLIPLQHAAIKHAKHVYDSFGSTHISPADEESSTTVFKLVEELIKY